MIIPAGFRALLLLPLLAVMAACQLVDIQDPQVQVSQYRFHSKSLTRGRLDTRLMVHNPNRFSLPIKSLSYSLLINGRELLNGKSDQSLKLAAGGTRDINLPLDIDVRKILHGLDGLFSRKHIQFQLRGEIDFGLIRVPYRKSGEFRL